MAKRTYRVTGELPVAGHATGEEFQHDFGDQADVLIESGHIKAVVNKAGNKAEPDIKQKEG